MIVIDVPVFRRRAASLALVAAVALLTPSRVSAAPAAATAAREQSLLSSGRKKHAASDFRGALSDFSAGLALARTAGDTQNVSIFLTMTGDVERELGDFAAALRALQEALALDRRSGSQSDIAVDLTDVGVVQEKLGRYADAMSNLQQSLAIGKKSNDRYVESIATGGIGLVQDDLGRYADAFESQQQSLALDRLRKDRDAQATDLTNIGIIQDHTGRYADALQSHRQALALNVAENDLDGQATDIGDIAIIQEDLGQPVDALKSDQQMLALYERLGDRSGVASAYNDIGAVDDKLSRYADAVRADRKAILLFEQMHDVKGQAILTGNIGKLAEDLGGYPDALHAHQRSLLLARQIGDLDLEADELGSMTSVDQRLGRYTDAIASAHEATKIDTALGAPRWRNLWGAASAEANAHQDEAALDDYEAAVVDIERLRAGLKEKSDKTSFFGSTSFVYDDYIEFLLDLGARSAGKGYDRKALEIFERQQARTFLEQIAESAARNFAGVPAEVSDREAVLSAQVAHLSASLARASSAAKPEAGQVASLKAETAAAVAAQSELESTIATKYPAYSALLHPSPLLAASADPARLTIDKFQATVVRPGEALLVYDVLGDRTALWVVTTKSMKLVVIPSGTKDITAKLAAFETYKQQIHQVNTANSTLAYLGRHSQENLPALTSASSALYDAIVPTEIRPLIADASTLFVVPSGPLYGFPFETLVTARGAVRPHYLIEDTAISYLSSASLLALLRSGTETQARAPDALVAFANPAYAQSNFPALPGTDDEAHAVFTALGLSSTDATLHEGEDASVATVDRLNSAGTLKDYRYVFFGAHAVLPDQIQGLAQSSLVLAHPPAGFLTMGDVFGLSLDARAVVLSACESGGGTLTRGEGVQGLTQAFMYAGTPVVSVTDWEVIDQIQPDFNKAFFSALAGGKGAAAALRDAKIAMLAASDTDDSSRAQPYFWAPTVIFGDGDAP